MIELQRCTDSQVWDDYVLDQGGHPLQLWGWGQLKMAHGWSADRLLAYDENDEIVAAAQVLTRKLPLPFRAFSYIPRGPVGEQGSSQEFLELIADFTKREHHSVVLSIEPDAVEFEAPQGWIKTNNSILPSTTITLDLTKSDSDLLSVMRKETRQDIRQSTASDIVIKQVRRREDLEKCLEIYHQSAARSHIDLHEDQYYYDAFNLMGEYSPVFAAYKDNVPIAFLWIAISTTVGYQLYDGMNEEAIDLHLDHALTWYAIRKLKEWELERYDFGGLIEDDSKDFKKGWDDQATQLVGTYDHPLSKLYGMWNSSLPRAKKLVRKLKKSRH